MSTRNLAQAPIGSLHIRRQGARLWVHWRTTGYLAARVLRTDFRATFPKHRDATYSHTRREWSVPLHQRERLLDWCATWGLDLICEED